MNASLVTPELAAAGEEMYRLLVELYPICRSITGEGFRQSLRLLQTLAPMELHEVPTGTTVFDWTVPNEWNVRDAYVRDAHGRKVIDFRASNLHLLNYSVPVRARLPLAELKAHLYSLPDHPDWIPYRTSYYTPAWGFCLAHRDLLALEEGEYEVVVDTTLAPGHLTYGEYCLPGETDDEVLISCHSCHPSLCNDNLSGMVLAAMLARRLSSSPRRYTYRFLFVPGTIGAVTWLARNEGRAARIKHGLVVACVGDPGPLTYKKSRRGNAEIDRAVQHVLGHTGQAGEILEFSPYGYDERQYCSPGFNLPVGSLTRTPHGRYPQYHTSADDLSLVQPAYLADSLAHYLAVIEVLENNRTYVSANPKCEPQFGKRGLYRTIGGEPEPQALQMALLWVQNLADGDHTLLDMAERAGLPFTLIQRAANHLHAHGLLHATGARPE
jgi:aminopeptidase-like protein